MTEPETLPQKRMLLIAALQGIALLWLKNAFESGAWPSASPAWSFPLWTLAIALPVLLLLSLERDNARRLLLPLGAFIALLTLAAVYTGYQATPHDAFPVSSLVFVFTASVSLACFKALMYVQQRASGQPLSYDVLFTWSWRNALTLALALILTFVFWLILMLWGALFRTIGIEFFAELFEMDWFLIPVLAIAHGVGIVIFRNLTQVIDSISRLLRGLIKLLLPLAVAVAVIFVATLPFVGLEALWSTGRGTSLLLWLLAIVLFFVNAVYQDGRGEPPYPLALHRALYASLCVLPLLAALSFYGLWLRVEQYGWSVARSWAFVAWLVLALFAAGYVIGIVRRRDLWTQALARVNTVMGFVVLALMLAANSPVLDFRKIAADSQLGRLDAGEVDLRDFDFWYAHHELGRPGHLLLDDLRARAGDDSGILDLIDNPRRFFGARPLQPDDAFWSGLVLRPAPFDIPADLKNSVQRYGLEGANVQSVLARVDIDEDGDDEYILTHSIDGAVSSAFLYYRRGNRWENTMMSAHRPVRGNGTAADDLLQGDIGLRAPAVKNVVIGDVVLRVMQPEALGRDDRAPE